LSLARQQQPCSQANSLEVVEKNRHWNKRKWCWMVQPEPVILAAPQQAGDNLELAQLGLKSPASRLRWMPWRARPAYLSKSARLNCPNCPRENQDYNSDTQIQAPFDGQVVYDYEKEYTAAEAFRTAVILVDIAGWEIRASPADTQLQVLEEGMPVSISTIAEPGTVQGGKVSSLPYPYGSGEASDEEARIDLEPGFSLGEYELGDLMQITVIIAQKSNAWLPS
jgi:hypothetical protein